MKRIISVLLVAVMAFATMSLSAFAEDEINNVCGDNLTWSFNEETGELAISGTGKMTNYSATSSAPWDEFKAQIKKLTVADGVTAIGNDTFVGCGNLEEIVLPESLTKIGDSAFRDCVKLTEIAIPDAVKSLGHYAFYGCTGLTELRLGNGVKTLGNYAFRNSTNIKLVIMPETLTSIGKGAFMDCGSIAYAAFKGTSEQWSAVTVGVNNEALTAALVRFGDVKTAGDINGDTLINSADALCSLNHATKTIELMDDAFAMADVDGNGKINSFDALLILEYSVGQIESF
jgi:hypothetical protein